MLILILVEPASQKSLFELSDESEFKTFSNSNLKWLERNEVTKYWGMDYKALQICREVLLYGKAQYGWPPCTN